MPDQTIVIGERGWTREEWFREEEEFRKERARLSFEAKISILVEMQKLAQRFGQKEEVLIWEISPGHRPGLATR